MGEPAKKYCRPSHPLFNLHLHPPTGAAGPGEIEGLGVTFECPRLLHICLPPPRYVQRDRCHHLGSAREYSRSHRSSMCRGEKKKKEREAGGKKIPHCQSNAKLSLSGMSRADATVRCQSGSPSSVPWVPINCSGARLSASSSPGRWYPGRILRSVSLSLRSRPRGARRCSLAPPLQPGASPS